MKRRWTIAPARVRESAELGESVGASPLLAQCLLNRGVFEADRAAAFLGPRLRSLAAPERVPGLTRAVDRLWRARTAGEPVAIFGDYDVDGVTATALLLHVLRPLGWRVSHYLPNRLDEGYGLTRDAAEHCVQQGPVELLVAVDCGSTAVETIRWLKAQGVETIVLDHHQVSDPPPDAVALVNPRVGPDGGDDFRELCAAGLAFKLAHGLVKHGRQHGCPEAGEFDLRPLLDLVALGTIADLVPLLGENRVLASAGLEWLRPVRRPGLRALAAVAHIEGPIRPYEVGFQLAPRLNAAGRLEDAAEALEILVVEEESRARALAESLDAKNRERQNIERSIAAEVVGAIRARFDPGQDYVLVEGQLLWHVGVVGIVASRVLQEFHRPTIVLGGDGHEWRGSGRSIAGFDLAAALRECDDLLVRHGGHAMAAGLTVRPENVAALRGRLNALARERLTPEQLEPVLRLDAEAPLGELTLERVEELERLQPHGQGNPVVQVVARRVRLSQPPCCVGRERQHLKFRVTDGRHTLDAIWWGGGGQPWPQGEFDLACAPQVNEFNDRRMVQLRVLDWRPAAG